jgi:hypothetical protein
MAVRIFKELVRETDFYTDRGDVKKGEEEEI